MNFFKVIIVFMGFVIGCEERNIGEEYEGKIYSSISNEKKYKYIESFRIDEVENDRILIKYKVDGVYLNSYIYLDKKINRYYAKLKIDVYGVEKENIEITLKEEESIIVYNSQKSIHYKYVRKMITEDYKKNNPYYAEDGWE